MGAGQRLAQMLMFTSKYTSSLPKYRVNQPTNCIYRQLCSKTESKRQPLRLSHNVYEGSHPETPVLILHGLLGSGKNFAGIAKQLVRNTGRTVVTFDARNHGNSEHADDMGFEAMASDVVSLLHELQAETCIPIGHSLGGRTAMTLALCWPELVEKLVLIDISPIHHSQNLEVLHILEGMMEFHPPAGASIWEARRYASIELAPVIQDENVRDFILTNLVERDGRVQWRVNLDVIMRSFRELGRIPLGYPAYARGQALFIAGGQSDYIKEEDLPDIAKFFPCSEVKTIEGSDHWVHYHKPRELIKLLTEFLND